MKKSHATTTIITASVAAAALLGGCANRDPVSFTSIRNNLSPELASTADRAADIDRHLAVKMDLDTRSFWDDVQRVWYIDHPSRLSPYPITYTSGNPR